LAERSVKKIPWVDIALWVPTLFLVWVFANQGWSKFSDTSGWAQAFAAWHFPVWFRILIGVCEVSAAALLLMRRTAPIGAALIACVMLGGMGTHVYRGHPGQITSEVVPLTLSLIVLLGRQRHLSAWVAKWRQPAE
jgi:uncharacterized membrane protein YphA (DoxX/SURF4 family)